MFNIPELCGTATRPSPELLALQKNFLESPIKLVETVNFIVLKAKQLSVENDTQNKGFLELITYFKNVDKLSRHVIQTLLSNGPGRPIFDSVFERLEKNQSIIENIISQDKIIAIENSNYQADFHFIKKLEDLYNLINATKKTATQPGLLIDLVKEVSDSYFNVSLLLILDF
jgi:hypothetical protein